MMRSEESKSFFLVVDDKDDDTLVVVVVEGSFIFGCYVVYQCYVLVLSSSQTGVDGLWP